MNQKEKEMADWLQPSRGLHRSTDDVTYVTHDVTYVTHDGTHVTRDVTLFSPLRHNQKASARRGERQRYGSFLLLHDHRSSKVVFLSSFSSFFLRIALVRCPDYHYVTREAMQAAIERGDFIESAEFSGNIYGTSKAAVQDVRDKNLICILDIDIQGVKNIKRTDLHPFYIFIQPPSMAVLVSTAGNELD